MMTRMLMFVLAVSFFGCEPKTEEAPKSKEPAPKIVDIEKTEPANGESVTLTAEGTKFDPAIKPEQLPDGAFYCDMGTVHWAASKKPADNKCPECGMMLKEYSAKKVDAQKEGAVDEKPADDGHKHEEGEEHDHEH